MTFGIARGVAVDASGNVQTGVWVEVRRMVPGYPLATPLYEDSEGAATLANPFFSTSGEWEFYAVGGRYRARVYKTGYDKTWDNVPVGTAQAADIDAYAAAGFTWAPESATAAPPSNGCIRFNNASVASATHIYVDQDTLSGTDAGTWLLGLDPGSKSTPNRIMISTSDSEEASWAVSDVTDAGAYLDITVTDYVGPAGPISFGDSGFLTVSREISGSDASGNTVVITSSGTTAVAAGTTGVVINLASPGSVTLTLPAAAAQNGLPLTISDWAGNATITLTPDGSEKIMGLSSASLVSAGQGLGTGASVTLKPVTSPAGWFN